VDIVVSVSDAKTSRNPQDALLTHALGSCIGVMLYDDLSGVAGMLHFQLPNAGENPHRAEQNPAMFADTGMAYVLGQMQQLGAMSNRLHVKIAGGAEMLNDNKLFNIGRRNHAAIRKILWQHGLMIASEDVGGKKPRTVRMDVANGSVTVKSNGEVTTL
jgi:chemotaxis protein CheD